MDPSLASQPRILWVWRARDCGRSRATQAKVEVNDELVEFRAISIVNSDPVQGSTL